MEISENTPTNVDVWKVGDLFELIFCFHCSKRLCDVTTLTLKSMNIFFFLDLPYGKVKFCSTLFKCKFPSKLQYIVKRQVLSTC